MFNYLSNNKVTDTNLDSHKGPGHTSLVDPDGNAILINMFECLYS